MENKEKKFVSAVVYVYNAEKRVAHFLRTLISVLKENFEHSEIICVNDSSNDNSRTVIKEIAENAVVSVSIVNMSYFHGREIAMNAGTDLAIGDFVFEFDSTFMDFGPDEIMMVYRKALGGV